MLHNLTGWHALIVLAILLLVFGSTKLPALAKGVGQSLRIFKDEARDTSAAPTERVASADPTADDGAPVPIRHAS
ncbi:twin-arginine translocase TatA/TatE family subunit [Rhodococcus corynebacterioides]|uniref:Sec-independent protein translocase protein TatA n=2 Tax=Rhodococcoides corynebacterioides TaxID=53972 RepID=A0ABS7P6U6_9NOCA|nr:twin-arginine translocase TatA/TatE family subunit [Rhodococcus corynebacterioides]MBY6368149.1 twin-arginine translocase TatA/TatE family subunit [Rhodococcus corynebacterioides]MBY6409857.1 twin-arginine translocase TatA/TatE family subunit [Rhodococcus corynebacterioides]